MIYMLLVWDKFRQEDSPQRMYLKGNMKVCTNWIEENLTRFDNYKLLPFDDEAVEDEKAWRDR